MAGEFGLRLLNLARTERLHPHFERAEQSGHVSPELATEIATTIADVERGLPRRESASERKDWRELLLAAQRDPPAKIDWRYLEGIVIRVRFMDDYTPPWSRRAETSRSHVMLADCDGRLYGALVSASRWIGSLFNSWPEPIMEHEDGSTAIFRGANLKRLQTELDKLADDLSWFHGSEWIDDREVAMETFVRLRKLVARALSNPDWAIAVETFL